jgi:hypothetical protein
MAKHQAIIGHNIEPETLMPLTHPADIADTAFSFLNALSFTGRLSIFFQLV